MNRERFPWIYDALDARCRGDVPRFEPPIHRCWICKREWMCSDRYTEDFCGPSAVAPSVNSFDCSPCMAKDVYDEDDAAAWWEAHGVTEMKCTRCGQESVEADAVCSACLWDNIAGERAVISRPDSPTVRRWLARETNHRRSPESNTQTTPNLPRR